MRERNADKEKEKGCICNKAVKMKEAGTYFYINIKDIRKRMRRRERNRREEKRKEKKVIHEKQVHFAFRFICDAEGGVSESMFLN